jgi:hypothetical protein
LEDIGIREAQDQQQFLVFVLANLREVLVEDVSPDRAGVVLQHIGERIAKRSFSDSNTPVLITSKTPMNSGVNGEKTGQNPMIGQS